MALWHLFLKGPQRVTSNNDQFPIFPSFLSQLARPCAAGMPASVGQHPLPSSLWAQPKCSPAERICTPACSDSDSYLVPLNISPLENTPSSAVPSLCTSRPSTGRCMDGKQIMFSLSPAVEGIVHFTGEKGQPSLPKVQGSPQQGNQCHRGIFRG